MVPLGVVASLKKGASEMGKKLISSTKERIERKEIFNGFRREKCAGEILIGRRRRVEKQ